MFMPDWIGAASGGKRVTPVFGDDNEAAQAELQRWVFSMQFAPDLAVAVVVGARVFGRVETHHVQTLMRSTLGGLERMDAVPHRRVGLLQRLEFHRNVFEGKKFTFERERLVGKSLEDQRARFGVDVLRLSGILAVKRDFRWLGAPTISYLYPDHAQLHPLLHDAH